MENEMKSFGTTLKFNSSVRHIMFEGEDSNEQDKKFDEAISGLTQIGDLCKNSEEFFDKAIHHIQHYGFRIIKK